MEVGGGEGGGEITYLSVHCHHQNDSGIKMGSDESHFSVSLIVRDKVTRRCPQTTTFEARGKPKRNRADALLLSSLTPYRWAKPAHILESCTILNVSMAPRSSKTELALKLRIMGIVCSICCVH